MNQEQQIPDPVSLPLYQHVDTVKWANQLYLSCLLTCLLNLRQTGRSWLSLTFCPNTVLQYIILRLFSQDLQQFLFFTIMSGTLIWVCLEICVVHNTPGKSTLLVVFVMLTTKRPNLEEKMFIISLEIENLGFEIT